jgi:electron transfer flavoprotein beta subunit
MNIAVLMKQVPDLAEDLEIAYSGTELDREYMEYVTNEFDEYALEEALQLKEATGGTVTAIALGTDDVDDVLYTAVAKGADAAVRVGDFEDGAPPSSHAAAQLLAAVLKDRSFDLVLTGVQAIDDLDGWVGPLVASHLGLPHVSVVTHIEPADGGVTVGQEYSGGIMAEFDVSFPAILGVQASRVVPRYAPVSKVRQAMQSTDIEEVVGEATSGSGVTVRRLSLPEASGHAEMIQGGAKEVAERLATILKERGLVAG